jgi:hypothetical protein
MTPPTPATALDAAWTHAGYSSSRSHGVHSHEGGRQGDGTTECCEWVIGDCLRAALAAEPPALDVERLARALDIEGLILPFRTPEETATVILDRLSECAALAAIEGSETVPLDVEVAPTDFLPGGDGYPSWKDPLTGKDKEP